VEIEDQKSRLGEAAERLQAQTRIAHTIAGPFDRREVVILGVKHSVAEVQAAVARAFVLTWESVGEPRRYHLKPAPADQRVRNLRRAAAAAAGKRRMVARLEEVRRLALLPDGELRRRGKAGDDQADNLLHPRSGAMSRLLLGLPEPLWSRFLSQEVATVRYSDLPPESRAVADQVLRGVRGRGPGGVQAHGVDLLPERGVLELRLGGRLDRPTIWGRLTTGYIGMVHNLLYAEAAARQPPSARRRALPRRKPPKEAPLLKKVTLRDHPRPATAPTFPGERPAKARPLAEFLDLLRTEAGLPIVAECEYRPQDAEWLRAQWWLAADIIERPLYEALDLLCADFEYEWEFRGGMLLLRPQRWWTEPEERGERPPAWTPIRRE
jgi:hypothetical protein